MTRFFCLLTAGLLATSFRSAIADSVPPLKSPLDANQARAAFVLSSPDLRIELVAAEPEVVDPVAIAFGNDGSLWVVEMRDYPYGPRPGTGEKPQSRIKHLRDANGDGRFETATVFADELLFPTGLMLWQDGLIVTLAGEITFFADRDHDGSAEVRETWFTGFTQENSQLRANHPTLGPDGRIYVANGLRGGTIVAARPDWKSRGQQVALAGFDFAFDPRTGEAAAVSGHGQFGLCFDEFGNRFVCSNRNPVQHVVMEDQYFRRNPFLAVRTVVQDVAAFAEQSRLYPISKAWTTSTLHANQFTAACGVQIFRGDALPPEYQGNAFTCDPTGNLVHREVLTPRGASFHSQSADGTQEFLASPDTWFRPVNLTNGPDGALYVVDMYRAVIEHPDWMPAELKTRKDLRDGSDRGRIWRVTSLEPPMLQERPEESLDRLTTADLVDLLEHRSGWHRDTAQRLLIERDPRDVVEALKSSWKQNKLTRSRIRILWLLQTLDPRLTPAVAAWTDITNRDARVREQVVQTIGNNLTALLGDLAEDVIEVETDDRVRFRLALGLGAEATAENRRLMVLLLDRGAVDPWLRTAVSTMKAEPPEALVLDLLTHWEQRGQVPRGGAELLEQLCDVAAGQLTAMQAPDLVPRLLAFTAPSLTAAEIADLRIAGLRGLGQGGSRRGIPLQARLESLSGEQSALLDSLIQQSLAQVADRTQPASQRQTLLRSLRHFDRPDVVHTLLKLALSDEEAPLKIAALDALGASASPTVGGELLNAFERQTPPLRRAILDVLLTRDERIALLLEAVEQRIIAPGELDLPRQNRLIKHRVAAISERAARLFQSGSTDRAAVLAQYQPVLERRGDPARGRLLFEKNCVTCHRIDNQGVNVGPDISDTRDKTPAYLLTNILDPNRAVDANFFSYTVVTKQGKVLTGLIKGETAASVTLRLPEGKEETLLRADLEEFKSSGQSLMPVGLERTLTVDQMADLIAYLKNWRYLNGQVPLAE